MGLEEEFLKIRDYVEIMRIHIHTYYIYVYMPTHPYTHIINSYHTPTYAYFIYVAIYI